MVQACPAGHGVPRVGLGGVADDLQQLPSIPQHQNQLPGLPSCQQHLQQWQQRPHLALQTVGSSSSSSLEACSTQTASKDPESSFSGSSSSSNCKDPAAMIITEADGSQPSDKDKSRTGSSNPAATYPGSGVCNAKDTTLIIEQLESSCTESIYDLYSRRRKFLIVYATSVAAILMPLCTTMYLPALKAIQIDLHTTDTLVASSVAIYMFMVGICALFWGPASDRFGRRKIYLISHSFFLCISLLCIFAPNIASLVAFRALQGASVAAYGACNAGVAADVFQPAERGSAMGISAIPVLVGPIIGPLLGGVLTQTSMGWRSTFIFITALGGLVIMPLLVLAVPETHQYKTLMTLRKVNLKKALSIKEALEISSAPPRYQAPWYPIRILLSGPIILHATLTLLGFGSYLCAVTMLPIFLSQPPYSLSPSLVGVAYLPVGVAGILGCPLGGRLCDRSAAKDSSRPMRRLHYSNFVMLLLMPAALVGYGWSLQFRAHLALPLAFIFLVQLSNSTYLPAIFGYLTQVRQHAASAAAAGIYSLMFIVSGLLIQVAAAVVSRVGLGTFMTMVAGLDAICALAAAVQIQRTCWPATAVSSSNSSDAAETSSSSADSLAERC